jgi:hypothetical protein
MSFFSSFVFQQVQLARLRADLSLDLCEHLLWLRLGKWFSLFFQLLSVKTVGLKLDRLGALFRHLALGLLVLGVLALGTSQRLGLPVHFEGHESGCSFSLELERLQLGQTADALLLLVPEQRASRLCGCFSDAANLSLDLLTSDR